MADPERTPIAGGTADNPVPGTSHFEATSQERQSVTNYAGPNDYIVRQIGTDYKAINGESGAVATSDSDFATVLQYAIDNAGADPNTGYGNGGTVLVWPGTHTLSSTVTLDRNGLTVKGFGWRQTEIQAADGLNADMFTLTTTDTVVLLEMSDLRIAGNYQNNTSGRGLYIPTSADLKDSRFKNLFISRTAGDGFRVESGWGSVLYNSVVESVQGSYAVYYAGSNPTVYGNKIIANPVDTADVFLGGNEIRFFGNHVAPSGSGTATNSVMVDPNRHAVVNNRISGHNGASTDALIRVNGKRGIVAFNQILDANRFGIWVSLGQASTYSPIVGNQVNQPGQDGIRVSGTALVNSNIVVGAGQDSAGTYHGIRLDNGPQTVVGNFIDGESQTENGVLINTSDNCRVASNTIVNVTAAPIDNSGSNNAIDGVVADTYTGDGTTNRRITLGFRPRVVLVEESGGTLFEVRDDGLSLIDGSSPTGELSIQNDGFEVGDNGADADPNTDTETYTFRAVA